MFQDKNIYDKDLLLSETISLLRLIFFRPDNGLTMKALQYSYLISTGSNIVSAMFWLKFSCHLSSTPGCRKLITTTN